MGLFDEIRCEYPLPESGYRELPGHTFQTKSLGSGLDKYTITSDGTLIQSRRLGSEGEEKEEIPYHGDVYFYGSFAVRDEPGRVWIEYKARFTEGRLSRIEIEDVHDLPPLTTVEFDGKELPAAESGLGFKVLQLWDEAEVERDEDD